MFGNQNKRLISLLPIALCRMLSRFQVAFPFRRQSVFTNKVTRGSSTLTRAAVIAVLGFLLVVQALAQDPTGTPPRDSDRTGKPRPPAGDVPSEDELKQDIAVDPDSPQAWAGLGWRLYREKRYGEAEWAMREARERAPNDPYVLWISGLAAYQLGHFADAKIFLKRVYLEHKVWPETIDMVTTYDLLGRLNLEEPVDLFQAAYYLSLACDQAPKDWRLHFMLGFTEWYRGPGRYGQALEALETARRLNPKDPLVRRYYAWVKAAVEVNWPQEDGGKGIADALAVVNDAIAAEPDFFENYELLGRVQYARHDLAAAETALRKALSLSEDSAGSHYFLAKILLAVNTHVSRQEAEQHLLRAIALNPEYWEGPQLAPHVDLFAAHLMEEGRYSEAVALLEWRKRHVNNDEGDQQ